MADFEFRYIIQWLMRGAKQARDPRLVFFSTLVRSSSFDPHSLSVIEKVPGVLDFSGSLSYSAPNLTQLKKKKFVMERRTKKINLSILNWADTNRKVILPFASFVEAPLEIALALGVLYFIWEDSGKKKIFSQLIKSSKKEGDKE